jgi:hypothetical protein
MKTIKELRALPEFQLITTFDGIHPETGEPCKLAKVNQDQMLVIKTDDMVEFLDSDGSPMRVVNTQDGLMKMRI